MHGQQQSSYLPFAFLWGFILGPFLFIFSWVVIWYNQKRASLNYRRIKKLNKLVSNRQNFIKLITKSQNNIDETLIVNKNDPIGVQAQKISDKLLYICGQIQVNDPAFDDVCKVGDDYTLKIQRAVEVRQYRKSSNFYKNKPPELQWSIFHYPQAGGKINSRQSWFLKCQDFQAKQAYIKDYRLNLYQISSVQPNQKMTPTQQMAESILAYKKIKRQYIIEDKYIYFPAQQGMKLSHGSLRVSFYIARSPKYSILASEGANKILQPFRIDLYDNNGKPDSVLCYGRSICSCCHSAAAFFRPLTQIDIVCEGEVTAQEMINKCLNKNTKEKFIIRVMCFACMTLGIYLFFLPLVSLIGYIPMVGHFLSAPGGFFVLLGAFIICVPVYMMDVALPWVLYYRKIGLPLIMVTVIYLIVIVIAEETTKP